MPNKSHTKNKLTVRCAGDGDSLAFFFRGVLVVEPKSSEIHIHVHNNLQPFTKIG